MTYFTSQGKYLYQSPHKTGPLVDAKRSTLNRKYGRQAHKWPYAYPQ